MEGQKYEHEVVNHSKQWVNGKGYHTNHVEATWGAGNKGKIAKRNYNPD